MRRPSDERRREVRPSGRHRPAHGTPRSPTYLRDTSAGHSIGRDANIRSSAPCARSSPQLPCPRNLERRSRLMSLPSHEETPRSRRRAYRPRGRCTRRSCQRLRTLTEKLTLGTATVGVFGLDAIGLEFLVAAGADGTRVVARRLPTRTRPRTCSRPSRVGRSPHCPRPASAISRRRCSPPTSWSSPARRARTRPRPQPGLRAGQLVLVASDVAPAPTARTHSSTRCSTGPASCAASTWRWPGSPSGRSSASPPGPMSVATELGRTVPRVAAGPTSTPSVVVTLVDDDPDADDRR